MTSIPRAWSRCATALRQGPGFVFMDPKRFSTIAHSRHTFCNPFSEAKIATVISLLDLSSSDRAIDVGCGRAELLIRIVDRYGCIGEGIDINEEFLREGFTRGQASKNPGRIQLRLEPADRLVTRGSEYDLSICVGSSQAFGSYRDAIQALDKITRPGGMILLGEGYWRKDPDQTYLDFLATTKDELLDHPGNIEVAREAGLAPLYCCVSNEDDWDYYEGLYCLSVERYVAAHPADPDADAMLRRIRSWNRHYQLYGRDTLGFGLYLYQKPRFGRESPSAVGSVRGHS